MGGVGTYDTASGGLTAMKSQRITGVADLAEPVPEAGCVVAEGISRGTATSGTTLMVQAVLSSRIPPPVDRALGSSRSPTRVLGGFSLGVGAGDHVLRSDVRFDETDEEAVQTYPSTLDATGAEVDVTNTVTETSIYSFSLPANTLATGRAVRLWIHGDALFNVVAVSSFTLKVKLGATTLYDDATVALANSATRCPVWFNFVVAANGAASLQTLGGRAAIGSRTGTTTGLGDLATDEVNAAAEVYGTSAEDGTTALTLNVTITLDGATTTRSFRKQYACLEWL